MFWLLFVFAATTLELDVITLPLNNEVRVALTPGGRAELKREGTVTRIRLEIDRAAPASSLGQPFNTYVVWAISQDGLLDNLGELELRGNKGQLNATSRLAQFGVLITAEPHFMVDRPSSAVAWRSQNPPDDFRRRTAQIEIGAYDYSQLKPIPFSELHNSVVQARSAFQIAQASGAERLVPADFRNAQVAMNAMEELVNRFVPLDVLWPAAMESIRLSQHAAVMARARR